MWPLASKKQEALASRACNKQDYGHRIVLHTVPRQVWSLRKADWTGMEDVFADGQRTGGGSWQG
jgi:hypothetical protein